MVLYNVTPQLHPWLDRNSAMNTLTVPLSEWTLPHLFIGFLNKQHSPGMLFIKKYYLSQFHCGIARRCFSCSGISVMQSTAAGWLVALCTDAQRWQVHASAALNLCRASWVSLAHFTSYVKCARFSTFPGL